MSEDENEERESDQIANTVRNHVQMLLEDGVRDAQTIQDTVLERTSIRVNLDRIQEAIDERAEHLDMPMPDTPCVMSEARFDLDYGPTLNDSPLELLDSQVSVLSLYHVWTQADDAEGSDLLTISRCERISIGISSSRLRGRMARPWLAASLRSMS
jgi:hypothetical protein